MVPLGLQHLVVCHQASVGVEGFECHLLDVFRQVAIEEPHHGCIVELKAGVVGH